MKLKIGYLTRAGKIKLSNNVDQFSKDVMKFPSSESLRPINFHLWMFKNLHHWNRTIYGLLCSHYATHRSIIKNSFEIKVNFSFCSNGGIYLIPLWLFILIFNKLCTKVGKWKTYLFSNLGKAKSFCTKIMLVENKWLLSSNCR